LISKKNSIPIIISICAALAGNAFAGTITVRTEPPALDVSVDGEYLGKAPVIAEEPFGNTVKITVSGEGIEEFTLITSPPEGDTEKIIEVDGEKGFAISRSGIFRPGKPPGFLALVIAGVLLIGVFIGAGHIE